jgi:5-methylcytosine-specific restriction endonuclease McrA
MKTEEEKKKHADYMREYTRRNAEKINEQRRKRWRENNEHKLAVLNAWKADNPEKVKSYPKNLDPVKSRARQKRWDEKNPEKLLKKKWDYRARERNAFGTIKAEDWKALCEKYENRCLRCGMQGKVSLDHVVPLYLGGDNTIENAQPLCRRCNSWKGKRHIDYR